MRTVEGVSVPSPSLLARLAASVLLLALGCWDDDFIADQGVEFGRKPWTPAKVVGLIATSYNERDIETYTLLLDEDFRFHFASDDAGAPGKRTSWGLDEELISANNIFTRTENFHGDVLSGFHLEMSLIDTLAYTVETQDGAGEELRYDVTARLDIQAVRRNIRLSGDARYVEYFVSSTQRFILRPDPEKERHLVLVDQFDGAYDGEKPVQEDSTEYLSWGEIKSRFRYERTPGVWGLLEDHFVDVYTNRDSSAYDLVLDPFYEFEAFPPDPEDPSSAEAWNRTTELAVAGRMFHGRPNADGVSVESIEMEQQVLAISETTDDYPDRPPSEEWYDVNCGVHLVVVTRDPAASDGSGIVNREVLSYQDYVVRPDPLGVNTYLLRRQIEGEAILPKAAGRAATGATSWGEIKSLFL